MSKILKIRTKRQEATPRSERGKGYGVRRSEGATGSNNAAELAALSAAVQVLQSYWQTDENGCLYTTYNTYSQDNLACFGSTTISGGGSGGGGTTSNLELLRSWDDYESQKAEYALAAALGVDLKNRIEAGAVGLTVENSGSGNAVTSLSFNQLTGKLTAYNGSFLTAITKAMVEAVLTGVISTHSHASVPKLATARKIWGQGFDGTENITGTLKMNSGDIELGAPWNEHGTGALLRSLGLLHLVREGLSARAEIGSSGDLIFYGRHNGVNDNVAMPLKASGYRCGDAYLYYDEEADAWRTNKTIITAGNVVCFDNDTAAAASVAPASMARAATVAASAPAPHASTAPGAVVPYEETTPEPEPYNDINTEE